ncbi:MAG: TonB-dependent receptor domain-containing protein, partial [Pseudobacter sp.]|uniref:TonB-dependent receptor domain-containing protein n=1 Tax=Pseudobacter sp. TaxID=2045420 RepID=UPI003F804C3C
LQWETVAMFNTAIEFSSSNGRFSGTVEWYRKNASNLYSNLPVDPTLGLNRSSITANVGKLRTTGLDLELTGRIITGKIKWTSSIIVNHSKDKLIKYFGFPSSGIGYNANGRVPLQGYSLQSLFAYRWAGLDPQTGEPTGFFNGEKSKSYNKITSGAPFTELRFMGSSIPTVEGNFTNSFSWKSFALTVSIKYRLNYFVKRPSISYEDLFTLGIGHSDFYQRWQKPGDENHTNVPVLDYAQNGIWDTFYNNAEIQVRKGDHIRLQFLRLSWSLDKKALRHLPVEGLVISANVSNSGILWKAAKDMDDPDNTGIRTPAMFNLGMNITLK